MVVVYVTLIFFKPRESEREKERERERESGTALLNYSESSTSVNLARNGSPNVTVFPT